MIDIICTAEGTSWALRPSLKLAHVSSAFTTDSTVRPHLKYPYPNSENRSNRDDIEMQYTATFKGRMVQATYELINNEIVVSGVKVMTEEGWERSRLATVSKNLASG